MSFARNNSFISPTQHASLFAHVIEWITNKGVNWTSFTWFIETTQSRANQSRVHSRQPPSISSTTIIRADSVASRSPTCIAAPPTLSSTSRFEIASVSLTPATKVSFSLFSSAKIQSQNKGCSSVSITVVGILLHFQLVWIIYKLHFPCNGKSVRLAKVWK